MSKKRKQEPEPIPRPRRGYPMPKNYLWKMANDIYAQRNDVETVYNTLKELWCDCYTKAYLRSNDDSKRFRMAREAIIKEIFDAIADKTEDIVRGGVVTNNYK